MQPTEAGGPGGQAGTRVRGRRSDEGPGSEMVTWPSASGRRGGGNPGLGPEFAGAEGSGPHLPQALELLLADSPRFRGKLHCAASARSLSRRFRLRPESCADTGCGSSGSVSPEALPPNPPGHFKQISRFPPTPDGGVTPPGQESGPRVLCAPLDGSDLHAGGGRTPRQLSHCHHDTLPAAEEDGLGAQGGDRLASAQRRQEVRTP